MKILIKRNEPYKDSHKFIAYREGLCGFPIVGYGRTSKEALGDLIYNACSEMDIILDLDEEEYKRIKREYLKSR